MDSKGGTGMRRWGRRLAVLTAFGLSVLFNYWTVLTTRVDLSLNRQQGDYYNLLVDGFQAGRLSMKVEPHPALLALPPEARPGNAPYLLDASLYEGRYYLYFGVVPAVLLYWPYAALTGHDLPEGVAVQVVAALALLASLAWWREVRRRFFPDLPAGWEFLAVLALGFCTTVPSTLRHPLFYEVAILSGWAAGALMLWALMRAAGDERRRSLWLVAAGVAYGLAVGSRANLAPAGLLALAVGVAVIVRGRSGPVRERLQAWLRLLLVAGAGAAVIGAGLAAYNYARFGRVTEFGHSHQLGHNPQQMFRLTNLAHNLGLYYLTPPRLGVYFPFVGPGPEPAKPVDYIGREEAHGQWVWWLVLLAGGAAAVGRPGRGRGRDLVWVLAPVGVWFGVNLLVTGLTGVRANRYMLDFHPALVWLTLAGLGVATLADETWRRWLRRLAGAGVVAAVLFNLFVSLQVHGWLEEKSPLVFAALARRADAVVAAVAPGLFAGVGDRVVDVTWPAADATGRWPLVSAGPAGQDDGIWLDSAGGGRVRFVYQHGEFGTAEGPWFDVSPGGRGAVRIGGAFLLPPAHHAWYGGRSPAERLALKRRLRVTVDGEPRFERDVPSHAASPGEVRWGEWTLGHGVRHAYPFGLAGGAVAAPETAWLAERVRRAGVLRLRLRLPMDRYGVVEPLLQSGAYPRCDVIAVRYTRPGYVQLVHDCFGAGGFEGPEFAVDYGRPQAVEIEMPAANDEVGWTAEGRLDPRPGGRLVVRWEGREVLVSSLAMHPTSAAEIAIGANFVRATSSRALFAGDIFQAAGLGDLQPVQAGRLALTLDVDDVLLGVSGVLAFWRRDEQRLAALVWRRETPAAPVRLGWLDEGRVAWSTATLEPGRREIGVQLPRLVGHGEGGAAGRGLVDVEQDGRAVLGAFTENFVEGAVPMRAVLAGQWKGEWTEVQATKPELPGRVRLRFALPEGGLAGSGPLLCSGRAGAADLLYLRPAGGGRYVFGLDHWGYGGMESAPVEIAEGVVHTLVIEIGALFPAGEMPADQVRVRLNGQVVLTGRQAAYAAEPAEIVIGRNPHGMSTSGPEFRGPIYSIRRQVPATEP